VQLCYTFARQDVTATRVLFERRLIAQLQLGYW
jgi:hypothetical protein